MSKKTYFTLVTCAVMVAGVREEIPPGTELPDTVHQHDIDQLLRLGAIECPADKAAAEKAAGKGEREAQKAFQSERAAVLAAEESKSTGAAAAGGVTK